MKILIKSEGAATRFGFLRARGAQGALAAAHDAGCQEHDAAKIGAPAFAGEAQEVARTLVQRGGLADAARSSCGRPNGRHAWHAAGSAAHRCQKATARPIGCERSDEHIFLITCRVIVRGDATASVARFWCCCSSHRCHPLSQGRQGEGARARLRALAADARRRGRFDAAARCDR